MSKVIAITAWSMSRYNDYIKCPALAKYKHVDKLKEPGNAAMERGTAIHKLAEDYVKGLLVKLPAELKGFTDEFKALKAAYKKKKWPMIVEDQWAFTNTWDETEWNNWADCWLRVKIDIAYQTDENILYVTDYKTGKMNDRNNAEYMVQLELYALAALLMSTAEDITVVPNLWYLDAGATFPPEPAKFTKADLPKLKKTWEARVKPMLADRKFAPRPSNNCRWCHFRKENNGPCKF
jgi:RecB family exonuclease